MAPGGRAEDHCKTEKAWLDAGGTCRKGKPSYAESGKRAMRPENLLKISAALGVSADYLLTGDIIDKDLLLLSDKMRKLSPAQLRIVESIIDECHTLFHSEDAPSSWEQ